MFGRPEWRKCATRRWFQTLDREKPKVGGRCVFGVRSSSGGRSCLGHYGVTAKRESGEMLSTLHDDLEGISNE